MVVLWCCKNQLLEVNMKNKIVLVLCAILLLFSVSYADEKSQKEKDAFQFNEALNTGDGEGEIQEKIQSTSNKEETKENKEKDNKTKEREKEISENPNLKECIYLIDESTYKFFLYEIDMTDKQHYVDVHVSRNKIGSSQVLIDLVKEAEKEDDDEILAAVNGGFFAMGRLSVPITSIVENGKFDFIFPWGSLAYFNGENDMFLSRLGFEVLCSVNNKWEAPYGFSIQYINRLGDKAEDVSILNSMYIGPYPDHDMDVIEVKDKKVINVYNRIPKNINKNSYLIASESKINELAIKTGDHIDLEYRAFEKNNKNNTLPFDGVKTALGSSPTLIKNGEIAIDLERDDLKNEGWGIYNRRPRTMVGITKDKKLYMVVSPNMSLNVLSKIGLKLGLETAINMDGGGSSGMVVNGKYIYSQHPDRRLPNALLIKKYKKVPIRIFINGKERFYDTNPYIYQGRTMLPLRGILEDLECTVSWDNTDKRVLFEHYGKNYWLKSGEFVIHGEDKELTMDVPLLIKDGRSAISARYLSEVLGGNVSWNGEKRIVEIQIDSATEKYHLAREAYNKKNYEDAKSLYQEALAIYPKHISSIYGLASIDDLFENYPDAEGKYNEILALSDNHIPSLNGLGKIAENRGDYDNAISFYDRVLQADENNLNALKKLAVIYENKEDYNQSIAYYEKAYDLDSEKSLGYALARLYRKELDNNKENMALLKKTAKLYLALDDKSLAIEYYTKAYQVDNKDMDVIKNLASLYEASNEKLALDYYEKAYAINSRDIDLLKKLAGMYAKKDKKMAIKYYEEAYAVDAKDAEIAKNLAIVYEEIGEENKALKLYQVAYDLDTNDLAVIKKLARLYEKNSKKDYALRYYMAAFKMDKKDASLILPVIRLTYENNDFDALLMAFDKVNTNLIKDSEVYFYVAKVYEKKDNQEKAYAYYKKYLSAKPVESSTNKRLIEDAKDFIADYEKEETTEDENTSESLETNSDNAEINNTSLEIENSQNTKNNSDMTDTNNTGNEDTENEGEISENDL